MSRYTYEWQLYDPDELGPPTTVLDVLERTRKVLEREGAWCRSCWFHNRHPELDPNDAFCNDWSACLDGIVIMVTNGACRITHLDDTLIADLPDEEGWDTRWMVYSDPFEDRSRHEQNWSLINATRRALVNAINAEFPGNVGVVTFNDSHDRDREDVIRVVDRAIADASA